MNTFPVAVTREDKSGHVRPFTLMNLTRVPVVGEHIGYVSGTPDEESCYRVVAVLHVPLGEEVRPSDARVAEVWAVECEHLEPTFDTKS